MRYQTQIKLRWCWSLLRLSIVLFFCSVIVGYTGCRSRPEPLTANVVVYWKVNTPEDYHNSTMDYHGPEMVSSSWPHYTGAINDVHDNKKYFGSIGFIENVGKKFKIICRQEYDQNNKIEYMDIYLENSIPLTLNFSGLPQATSTTLKHIETNEIISCPHEFPPGTYHLQAFKSNSVEEQKGK